MTNSDFYLRMSAVKVTIGHDAISLSSALSPFNKNMNEKSEADHIGRMIEVVLKTARGDYSGRIDSSGKNDDLDTLADEIGRAHV